MAKQSQTKLTPKQEAFCKEYVIDFNATRSAISAGYSKKTAHNIGFEILKKDYITERIKKLLHATEEEYKISRAKVLKAVEDMAYMGEQEGNRRSALDMLMKHTGLYEKDNLQSKPEMITNIAVSFVSV